MKKQFISNHSLFVDSFRLGKLILESDFSPNFIMALWRGGTPTGMILQEYLEYHGIVSDHIAIRTSAYQEPGVTVSSIQVHGLDYPTKRLNESSKLLIVDDVFDTGRTLEQVLKKLESKKTSEEYIRPENIKIATLYYKPCNNQTSLQPDFYLHEAEDWLVFPHELKGLTLEEIKKHKEAELHEFFQ